VDGWREGLGKVFEVQRSVHPERKPSRIGLLWAFPNHLKETVMKPNSIAAAVVSLAIFSAGTAIADEPFPGTPGESSSGASRSNPMVGGAPMYATRDIVDNAVNSKDHTTLVTAVKAAGLVPTLKSAGPFTVFAPTNAAFAMLPAGTVDSLLKPENKAMLTSVLTYHVVPGRLDSAALLKQIGSGEAKLKTVAGGTLTATANGNAIALTDEKGGTSKVTVADVYQSNGVIHVVNEVLMPK
jgi:uncharacterized surface protein with fasciclin (FAS1) repeats